MAESETESVEKPNGGGASAPATPTVRRAKRARRAGGRRRGGGFGTMAVEIRHPWRRRVWWRTWRGQRGPRRQRPGEGQTEFIGADGQASELSEKVVFINRSSKW